MYTDIEEIKTTLVYECIKSDFMNPTNIITTELYLLVRKLVMQLGGVVKLSQIKEIVENDNIRCIIIGPTPIREKKLRAIVSYGQFYDCGKIVRTSAEHCQDNKNGGEFVYNII